MPIKECIKCTTGRFYKICPRSWKCYLQSFLLQSFLLLNMAEILNTSGCNVSGPEAKLHFETSVYGLSHNLSSPEGLSWAVDTAARLSHVWLIAMTTVAPQKGMRTSIMACSPLHASLKPSGTSVYILINLWHFTVTNMATYTIRHWMIKAAW